MIQLVRRISWQEPPKEISLREDCSGGAVRNAPVEKPKGALRRSRRIVLLIHGFNVDMCAAGVSYETFVSNLSFQWAARSIRIYWPGDAVPKSNTSLSRRVAPVVSALSFPFQPDRAERAAEVLSHHIGTTIGLRQRKGQTPIRLSIVAHSLGCRLALELIKLVSGHVSAGMLRIELVVLMAAAVPISDVTTSGTYARSLSKASKTVIYFSPQDIVLKYIFPVGQRSSSTNPNNLIFGRKALGLVGMPGAALGDVEQIEVRHTHGDYWRDRGIPQKVMVKLDGIQRRVSRRVLIPREFDSRRSMEGRSIAGRQIRGMARDNGCGCS